MKVFVTGASGFVGSQVVRQLLKADHHVAILLRVTDPAPRLNGLIDQVEVIAGDLAETNKIRNALDSYQPEACIHAAWYTEPGKYLDSLINIELLNSSLHLLNTLADVGCQRIVMVGTCFEYDTSIGLLHEDSPTSPQTLYAATKLGLQLAGENLARLRDVSFAWARLFYLYGPFENPRRAIPSLINALGQDMEFPASSGEQIRDYLHVTDAANALVQLIEHDAEGVFNISSGDPTSMRSIMELIASKMDKAHLVKFGELPSRAWDPKYICGDNSRLRDETGWKPALTLDQGLAETISWWQQRDFKQW